MIVVGVVTGGCGMGGGMGGGMGACMGGGRVCVCGEGGGKAIA